MGAARSIGSRSTALAVANPWLKDRSRKLFGLGYSPGRLKDIPGMTDELMAKIRAAFVLEPDPDGTEAPNVC
jgi:hypothetical protein